MATDAQPLIPSKLDPLTPREKKFLKHLLEGKHSNKAAQLAGYSNKCLPQAAYQCLKSLERKIPDIAERIGFNRLELLSKYLRPALEANETKFFANKGIVMDQRDVIAWGPRLDALDMAFKVTGQYPNEKGNSINILGAGPVKVTIRHVGAKA